MLKFLRRACSTGALLCGITAVTVGGAAAKDVPNLVGTWTAAQSDDAYAGVLQKNPSDPASKPAFLTVKDHFKVVIAEQQGRAFYGQAIPPSGSPVIPLVGVVERGGKQVVISTLNGAYVGDIRGKRLELCWFDTVAQIIQVACITYEKAKPEGK